MLQAAEFHGWSSSARRYIAGHGGTNVDLGIYVTDYYESTRRLYSWLDERNAEWCRVAWEDSLALEGQLEKPELMRLPRDAIGTDQRDAET